MQEDIRGRNMITQLESIARIYGLFGRDEFTALALHQRCDAKLQSCSNLMNRYVLRGLATFRHFAGGTTRVYRLTDKAIDLVDHPLAIRSDAKQNSDTALAECAEMVTAAADLMPPIIGAMQAKFNATNEYYQSAIKNVAAATKDEALRAHLLQICEYAP